mmetsp:Transcript_50393/g.100233  ORF Transcript_50393/g.100233 Transcript_50393/m.100233 type:complete len:122 (-) Transcript_50393:1723-2088(-)
MIAKTQKQKLMTVQSPNKAWDQTAEGHCITNRVEQDCRLSLHYKSSSKKDCTRSLHYKSNDRDSNSRHRLPAAREAAKTRGGGPEAMTMQRELKSSFSFTSGIPWASKPVIRASMSGLPDW